MTNAAPTRGAHIYAEIGGMSADAGMAPEAISYINVHGTGTPANNSTETTAIRDPSSSSPPFPHVALEMPRMPLSNRSSKWLR